ncbi:hypothetical protein [Methylobacterium nodulans]|uniref:DUF2946 domain-containing protein n=1 Tax=Methylobacterium nodulans (strain LMG 21967 / CNCM I-2342 / ORS 2060) TaxID=460265 RepID=B8ILE6_METNO|nr:hypothetical protein [Methylobacterium nodulans]ACL60145.1 conserved hypothetical protein [Methylobacterium nodulans ORS 2060]
MTDERQHQRRSRLRAAVAMLALYGLVLQAFLTGLNSVPAASAAGVICAAHESGRESPGPHPGHVCCIAACLGPIAPCLPPGGQAAWPSRRVIAVAWQPASEAPARGPPPRPSSARGPPLA